MKSEVRGGSRGRSDPLGPLDREALEEERDFLLRSLDDLESERAAGDIDDDDYNALAEEYTARAAVVLDELGGRSRAATPSGRPDRSPARAALVIALVVVVAVGVGWWVAASSGTRTSSDVGSGDIRRTSLEELNRAAELTAEANRLLEEGDGQAAVATFQEAIATYDRVLELQPANAEAMAYRGWLLFNVAIRAPSGSAAELEAVALEWLGRAIEVDPSYADARIFRAIVIQDSDASAALADLAVVTEQDVPVEMRSAVEGLRSRLRAAVDQGSSTEAGGS